MKKIEELKNELLENMAEFSIDFAGDHSINQNNYICDSIAEYADQATSVYYSDQKRFYEENSEFCDDKLEEYGYNLNELLKECGSLDKLISKAGAIGEFAQNESILFEDLDNIIKLMAYDYILKNNIVLSDEQIEELNNDLENIDHSDRFNEILYIIENLGE